MSKGQKHSQETRLKMKEAALKSGRIPPSRKGQGKTNDMLKIWRESGGQVWNKGKKLKSLSEEHKRKVSEGLRGHKSPHWAGGVTDLGHNIKRYFKYREWRESIFKRDNWTCQECKERGGKLEAHHIKSFALIVRENNIKNLEDALRCSKLWDASNGQTMCQKCHKLTDNYGHKALQQIQPSSMPTLSNTI